MSQAWLSAARLGATALAIMVTISAAGCTRSGQEAACEGEWVLSGMSVSDSDVGSEELATLESLGLDISLSLNSDGSADLVFLGQPEPGTWKPTSTGCELHFSGDKISAKLDDGILTMHQDDQEVRFSRSK